VLGQRLRSRVCVRESAKEVVGEAGMLRSVDAWMQRRVSANERRVRTHTYG
jgi:hypothetical protein